MSARTLASSLRARWSSTALIFRLWWIGGAVLLILMTIVRSLEWGGCLEFIFVMLFAAWALPTFAWLLFLAWTRLTYRVSVRLLISYVLVAVLPFPLLLTLAGFGGYLLIGQYTSSSLEGLLSQVEERLADHAEDVLLGPEIDLREHLERGPHMPRGLEALTEQVGWMLVENGEVVASAGRIQRDDDSWVPAVPEWSEEAVTSGPFWGALGPVVGAVAHRGDRQVAVWLPLGEDASRVFSEGRWFEASFLLELAEVESRERGISFSTDFEQADPAVVSPEGGGLSTALDGTGWWDRRWIFFLRMSPEPRAWSSGLALEERSSVTLLTTSPREALDHLFRSPYRLGNAVWGAVLGLGMFFLLVYLAVAVLAAWLIFNIARSTTRLTRGAQQVEAGALSHRIPVRRRDQLGDLARSFNQMTGSVESMLDEVAENERLKSELELAREIQQSLLPARELQHGSLRVHAHFEPAAEVGGDYYDLFPQDDGRLIVAVGDVAGHGLPTGLLMAMVKSAVATLVAEGHRGSGLLERVNRFMLEQPRGHRMVTLALAEIDPASRSVEITNAAHPPLFLAGDTVEEILLPAFPVGFTWHRVPPSRRLELAADSRLVLYSDGLVEAVDANGDQFGFERLQDFLRAHPSVPSEQLLADLLADLESHTGGAPLLDDLTILVVDCGFDPD